MTQIVKKEGNTGKKNTKTFFPISEKTTSLCLISLRKHERRKVMFSSKEKDFKVRGTYRLRKEGRKNEWVAIDSKGHGVKLGTSDLKQAKKRAGVAIKKMEKTR
jgi:hypothetical protein|tara:strand:- start:156 stop:467 length:312 start_codon:yes stop_codon:yes gene_type:complete